MGAPPSSIRSLRIMNRALAALVDYSYPRARRQRSGKSAVFARAAESKDGTGAMAR